MKKFLAFFLVLALMFSVAGMSVVTAKAEGDLTFVIVPKCVHPWFDEVNKGAVKQAGRQCQD